MIPLPSLAAPHRDCLHYLANDRAAMKKLLNDLMGRSGLGVKELARRLGTQPQRVRAYRDGKLGHDRLSVQLILTLAQIVGARIYIEYPD